MKKYLVYIVIVIMIICGIVFLRMLQPASIEITTPDSAPVAPSIAQEDSQPQLGVTQSTFNCDVFSQIPTQELGVQKSVLPMNCRVTLNKSPLAFVTSIESRGGAFVVSMIHSGNKIQDIHINKMYGEYFYEGFINFGQDVNFDGYNDLRVIRDIKASSLIFDYLIFNPTTLQFEKDPVLHDLSNPVFDSAKQQITTFILQGASQPPHVATYNFKENKWILLNQ